MPIVEISKDINPNELNKIYGSYNHLPAVVPDIAVVVEQHSVVDRQDADMQHKRLFEVEPSVDEQPQWDAVSAEWPAVAAAVDLLSRLPSPVGREEDWAYDIVLKYGNSR